jgi:outer membrane beta-barrel protein
MRFRFSRAELLTALALLTCASAARAEDVIYGPDGAPTVVQRKLYVMSNKWEVGLAGTIALNTALVDQYGGLLTVAYHPNEWFDVGADILGQHTALSTLAQNVRLDLRARTKTPLKDEFANDSQLQFAGLLTGRLAPIYGKFNLAGEASIHFQAFLLAGAGVGAMHRESVNLCQDPGTGVCADGHFQTSDSLKPIGQVGGGFRFYFGQKVSFRAEARGLFFGAEYKEGNDLTLPSSGSEKSYLAAIVNFDCGISLLF